MQDNEDRTHIPLTGMFFGQTRSGQARYTGKTFQNREIELRDSAGNIVLKIPAETRFTLWDNSQGKRNPDAPDWNLTLINPLKEDSDYQGSTPQQQPQSQPQLQRGFQPPPAPMPQQPSPYGNPPGPGPAPTQMPQQPGPYGNPPGPGPAPAQDISGNPPNPATRPVEGRDDDEPPF